MDPAPAPETRATLVITIGPRPTPGLQALLLEQGFHPWTSASRHDLPTLLSLRPWALVLLDVASPRGRSLQSCAQVRALYAGPIAAVSTRAAVQEQLLVLETGVDEFLVWPQAPALLGARLRALVRREAREVPAGPTAGAPLRIGDLTIDPARREVRRDGRLVALTDLELDLLHLLARHLGSPVSRETIFRELRGLPHDGRDRSIDLRISRLRRKLGDGADDPRLILTVRGIGYQLAASPL